MSFSDKPIMASSNGTILLTGANGGLGTAILNTILLRPELSGCHGIYMVRDANTATAFQTTLGGTKFYPHDITLLNLLNLENVCQVAVAVNAKVLAGEVPPIWALILNVDYRESQG